MDEINAEAAKPAKKAAARAKKRADAGWEDIVPAAARWVAKDVRASSKGARLVRFKRRASISDVYLELLTPSILRACRKVAQKPVVYRGRKIALAEVYKTFALSIYMRALQEVVPPSKKLRRPMNEVFQKAKKHLLKHLKKKGICGDISVKKWEIVRNTLLITPEIARGKLSRNFRRHVGLGENVAVDEKQKKWRGRSPVIKQVKSKPDPVGHWTTQMACLLQTSGLPYVCGLYPFSGFDEDGESFEVRAKIWKWVLEILKYGAPNDFPVVCTDSFYLTNEVKELLQREGIPYHCSAKSAWFRPLWCHLDAKLTDRGSWAGMVNKNTGEVAVLTWSTKKKIGKKFLLSTLMKKVNGKQAANNPPGWGLYADMFKVCDDYNSSMGDVFWPYRLRHYTDHLNEVYHAHILLNTVHSWIELQGMEDVPSNYDLLVQLSEELFARACSGDLPNTKHW